MHCKVSAVVCALNGPACCSLWPRPAPVVQMLPSKPCCASLDPKVLGGALCQVCVLTSVVPLLLHCCRCCFWRHVTCSAENTSPVSRHSWALHVVESAPGYTWAADNWAQRPADNPWQPLYDDTGSKTA